MSRTTPSSRSYAKESPRWVGALWRWRALPTDPRALVVDFGGVLTTSLVESFGAFCRKEGLDPERMERVIRASYQNLDPESPVTLIETGKISTEEFERHLAERLSEGLERPISPDGLVPRILGELRPDDEMLHAVRRVRDHGILTALLSNSWDTRHYSDDLRGLLFDVVVISGEVGMRKPEPEIYAFTAEQLGVPPEACLFVDDHPGNVEAAERAGMKGILHRRAEETIPELEAMLGLSLSAT
ncbi:MAG: HAD family hydrolase [Actinomycetota bacterium]